METAKLKRLCPACSAPLDEAAETCSRCGTPLADGMGGTPTYAESTGETPVPPGMGEMPVAPESPELDERRRKPSRAQQVASTALVVVCVAVVGAAVLLVGVYLIFAYEQSSLAHARRDAVLRAGIGQEAQRMLDYPDAHLDGRADHEYSGQSWVHLSSFQRDPADARQVVVDYAVVRGAPQGCAWIVEDTEGRRVKHKVTLKAEGKLRGAPGDVGKSGRVICFLERHEKYSTDAKGNPGSDYKISGAAELDGKGSPREAPPFRE